MGHTRTWRLVAVVVGMGAAVLTGCGSAEEGGSASTADGSTTTSAAAPAGAPLVGSWVVDAGALLDETMANLGLPSGVTCSGPVTTTFATEGTFTRTGAVTCASGPLSASGRIDTSGTWTADDETLTVLTATPLGTMDVGGTTVPTPDGFGTGVAEYRVDGDTLTVTFSNPSFGTVTQTYTRTA
jgi:hypothetical protein